MDQWEKDFDDLEKNPDAFAPGEVKEKLKRLLKAGRRCSCLNKNCFDFANAPPPVVSNLSGRSNQYCGVAMPSDSDR